jgi:hypothetical protein
MSTKEMSAKAEERLDRKSVDTCLTKIKVLLFIYEGKESPAIPTAKRRKGGNHYSVLEDGRGGGAFLKTFFTYSCSTLFCM